MLKQIKLNKSESNDSVTQSFLANIEKNKQLKTDAINIYDLNSIKLQADVILKNIENQINKCSQWKSSKEQPLSLNTTQNTRIQQQDRQWSTSINKNSIAKTFLGIIGSWYKNQAIRRCERQIENRILTINN